MPLKKKTDMAININPLELSDRQITTTIFAVFSMIFLVVVTYRLIEGKEDITIGLLLYLMSAAIGCLVAFTITPYDGNEKERFASLGQTISAFITGYLLSKFDKPIQTFIDLITDKIKDKTLATGLTTANKVRLMGAVISFLASSITVYVYRATEYQSASNSSGTTITRTVSTTTVTAKPASTTNS